MGGVEMSEYKLVPVEPTQEMKDSGALSVTARFRGDGGWCGPLEGAEFALQAYRAMLDAAPSAPNDPYKALEAENQVLREQNFAMNKTIATARKWIAANGRHAPDCHGMFNVCECGLVDALRQIDEVMK